MTLSVVDLKKDRRKLGVDIRLGDEEGAELTEPLNLTYRPSAYTANTELEFNAMRESDWKSEMGLTFVERLVMEWDLEGEDDKPYPIDKDHLADLPSDFITQVIVAVGNDMGKSLERSNAS